VTLMDGVLSILDHISSTAFWFQSDFQGRVNVSHVKALLFLSFHGYKIARMDELTLKSHWHGEPKGICDMLGVL
jgi:hypothetical protein